MDNVITNYTFTVIEDGQVPLAGNFDTFNYTPLFLVVSIVLLLVVVFFYFTWLLGHSKRASYLSGENISVISYFFHPVRLLEREREIEYEVSGRIIQYLA